ncbi:hypothetical protein PIROE2DRAFT_17715 [Piromyces sp. E2]|nr:hypothetical protein PIROE2DRAFT_17715 [Piromyces sp. E2]|eukprot:OUM57337.1 hypothetical protein PIROE2DRAFT_17715 [Piromyces sp. E2]
MEDIAFLENPLNVYLLKQVEFKKYVDEIQQSLNSKEYLKQGCSIEEFVKTKWNISKTQAYRYVLCAKIIDQLKEFEIQPNYERLCRTLNKYAKTVQQMKLLWGMILKKTNKNVELITSSLVTKTWNELCKNNNFSNVCYTEKSFMNKVENTMKEHSKKVKQNQLKSNNIYNINTKTYSQTTQNQNNINKTYLISPDNSSDSIIIPLHNYAINNINNSNIKFNQYIIDDQYERKENLLLSSLSSLSPISQNNKIGYVSPSTEYCNQYQNVNQIYPLYYTIPTQQTIIYY